LVQKIVPIPSLQPSQVSNNLIMNFLHALHDVITAPYLIIFSKGPKPQTCSLAKWLHEETQWNNYDNRPFTSPLLLVYNLRDDNRQLLHRGTNRSI